MAYNFFYRIKKSVNEEFINRNDCFCLFLFA